MRSELTTLGFLDRAENHYEDFVGMVTDNGTEYTYGEFAGRIHQLTRALSELGVGEDDRVAIVAGNHHYVLETVFAANQLGAVNMPLNYRLTSDDYAHILAESDAKAVVADPRYAEKIQAIRDEIPPERFVGYDADGIAGDWTDYESVLDGRPTHRPDRPAIAETDDATVNYTSGTTGDPKGVVRTHRTESLRALVQNGHFEITDGDVYLWLVPMFHVTGWQHPYSLTGIGAKQVCQGRFDPERTFEQIQNHDVSYFCAAPTVLNKLIEHYEKESPDTTGANDVRLLTGGSPPPEATIRAIEDEMGWRLIHIYGHTESGPITTSESSRHVARKGRFEVKPKQGFGVLDVSIRVVDDDGDEVPRDDETMGEIVVRGNQIFDRYLEKPELTEAAFNEKIEDWFHSGDVATWDEYGMVTIKDRAKDIIISGGENISSAEVENVLYDHPEIRKAAVVASPHEEWQETPKAFVVPTDDADLSADDVIGFAEENLASYKQPTKVEFADSLPETATGKVQKYELREREWTERGGRAS
jgi:fatty-acyl-CoA synthase